jgi:hypothetical protein
MTRGLPWDSHLLRLDASLPPDGCQTGELRAPSPFAYSPLGRDFLTGAFTSRGDFGARDFRSVNPRMSAENFGQNRALVAKVESFDRGKKATAAQVAARYDEAGLKRLGL